MAAKKTTKTSEKKHTSIPRTPPLREAAAKPAGAAAAEVSAAAVLERPATVSAPTLTAAAEVPAARPAVDVAELIAALRGSSADSAREAAEALGAAGNRTAVEPLAAVVANVDGYYHSVVRAAAAASLGRLGDNRAIPALTAGVRDPMAEASAEAVRALAALGDQAAVAPLVDVVRNADGYFLPVVRRAAVIGLAKLGGPAAAAVLKSVGEDDREDPVVRQAALARATG